MEIELSIQNSTGDLKGISYLTWELKKIFFEAYLQSFLEFCTRFIKQRLIKDLSEHLNIFLGTIQLRTLEQGRKKSFSLVTLKLRSRISREAIERLTLEKKFIFVDLLLFFVHVWEGKKIVKNGWLIENKKKQ